MMSQANVDPVAHPLKAALERHDFAALTELLAPDVRWGGDEDTDETCHTREEVLRWFRGLGTRGITARVHELIVERDAVIAGLTIDWSAVPEWSARSPTRYQVYRVRGGQVVDIRGYPERAGALASVAKA